MKIVYKWSCLSGCSSVSHVKRSLFGSRYCIDNLFSIVIVFQLHGFTFSLSLTWSAQWFPPTPVPLSNHIHLGVCKCRGTLNKPLSIPVGCKCRWGERTGHRDTLHTSIGLEWQKQQQAPAENIWAINKITIMILKIYFILYKFEPIKNISSRNWSIKYISYIRLDLSIPLLISFIFEKRSFSIFRLGWSKRP